jgi:hypothetical protein
VLDDAERGRMVSHERGSHHDASHCLVAPDGHSCSRLSNGFWGRVRSLDLGHLGYGVVAVAFVIWPGAAIAWKDRIQPKERT